MKGDDSSSRKRNSMEFHLFWNVLYAIGLMASVVVLMVEYSGLLLCESDQQQSPPVESLLSIRNLQEGATTATTTTARTDGRVAQKLMVNRKTNSFTVMQLTDLHLGEAEDTTWGPEQDRKTWIVLDKVMEAEEHRPDLIILSGDQLTANNVDENATAYYKLLGEHLSKYNIPWAMTFGNHDDAPLEIEYPNGTVIKTITKTSRDELLAIDQSFPLSLSQKGPDHLFGTTNYMLTVHDYEKNKQWVSSSNNETKMASSSSTKLVEAAQIVLLDSGGGTIPKQVVDNQMEWFHDNQKTYLPTIAFVHIPAAEFVYSQDRCLGFNGDGGIDPLRQDAGIVQGFEEAGNVHFIGVGHNHGNDYCCQYQTSVLHLCFGRHSGYGGYGSWDRGALLTTMTRV